jgi:hypothetical protein
MIKKVTEFVIDRAKWGNGEVIKEAYKHYGDNHNHPSDNSYLLREDSLMCCLGIYAAACGADSKDLQGAEMPEHTHNIAVQSLFDEWGYSDLQQAASVNDSDHLTAKAREDAIKKIFMKVGVKVTFKGRISSAIKTMLEYWN